MTTAHTASDRPAPLSSIEFAIDEIAAGRPIIVVDDEDRENEGDLIMAAELVSDEWMGFIIRHTSGVICAPITAERAAVMQLPPMVADNQDPKGTAYTISCDAADGVTTGISAADRARTARLLADPTAEPESITRPGHLFPLIAQPGGVLERDGHTEAGVDFARLAGLQPAAVIAEIVHDDGSMMRFPALVDFAAEHGLALVTIADLITYRRHQDSKPSTPTESDLVRGATVPLPTDYGTFQAATFTLDGWDHLVLSTEGVHPSDSAEPPLVRVHSECLTGDIFGSHRCDCGEQLDRALSTISIHGGHLIYLRGHEGRGIGLAAKLRAYALQDQGLDTVDANTALGFAPDRRDYAAATQILHALGITSLRLMTNNPDKIQALRAAGLEVERVPTETPARAENLHYLETKRDRMAHLLSDTLAHHSPLSDLTAVTERTF